MTAKNIGFSMCFCYESLLGLCKLIPFIPRPSAAECPVIRLSFCSSSTVHLGVGEKHSTIVRSVIASKLGIPESSQRLPETGQSLSGAVVFFLLTTLSQRSAWYLEDVTCVFIELTAAALSPFLKEGA